MKESIKRIIRKIKRFIYFRRKEDLNLLRVEMIMQEKWVGDINYGK